MSVPNKNVNYQEATNNIVRLVAQGVPPKEIQGSDKINWLDHKDGWESQRIDYAILEGRHTHKQTLFRWYVRGAR